MIKNIFLMGMVAKKYKIQGLVDLVPASVFLFLKDNILASSHKANVNSPHFKANIFSHGFPIPYWEIMARVGKCVGVEFAPQDQKPEGQRSEVPYCCTTQFFQQQNENTGLKLEKVPFSSGADEDNCVEWRRRQRLMQSLTQNWALCVIICFGRIQQKTKPDLKHPTSRRVACIPWVVSLFF